MGTSTGAVHRLESINLGSYSLPAHQASFEGPCGHDQAGRAEVLLKGLTGDRQGPALGTSQRKLLACTLRASGSNSGRYSPCSLCPDLFGSHQVEVTQPPVFLHSTGTHTCVGG